MKIDTHAARSTRTHMFPATADTGVAEVTGRRSPGDLSTKLAGEVDDQIDFEYDVINSTYPQTTVRRKELPHPQTTGVSFNTWPKTL